MLTEIYRKNQAYVPGLAALAVALAVYALTMSRSVGWHDSAELALTAWSLGANHAPGSPLHSLLGYLLTGLFEQPFIATTLLSVLSMSVAAGCAAMILARLGAGGLVATVAALLFAFSFQVWASAVITEVYGLGAMLLAGAMLFALQWEAAKSPVCFWLMTGLYSAAMAAYFANVLLGPLFLWFVYRVAGKSIKSLLLFMLGTGIALGLIIAGNYWLAVHAFPFGPVLPDTPYNMWFYMTGSQHDPLQARGAVALFQRLIEHGEIFFRSTGYVAVLLAVCGALQLHRQNRDYSLLLGGVFAIYMLYYTFFGSGDYFLMVVPAYFVFALWAGLGVGWVLQLLQLPALRLACLALLPAIVAGLVLFQFEGRRAMAFARGAELFAAEAFAQLPPETLAIAGWRELTTLMYLQQVEGLRPDIQFILPASTPRYYRSGRVDDYLETVASRVCTGPVFTLKQPAELSALYDLSEPLGNTGWVAVHPLKPCS